MKTANTDDLSQTKVLEAGEPELLDQVINLTGLPGDLVRRDLEEVLDSKGIKSTNLTLEELRSVMLTYLESMIENEEIELDEGTHHN